MSGTLKLAATPLTLDSYLEGAFVRGTGEGAALTDPVSGEELARASSAGLKLEAALRYARETGGPALRALTYGERGALLGHIADVLAAKKSTWYDLARANSGNTKGDAAIDVDGALLTLKYFARLGGTYGNSRILADGSTEQLTRSPLFSGLHVGVPREGVAIHINAFNFPSWGLWEKTAVALLSGVPVFSKPATATALLPALMVRAVADANVLPPGALSLLCGPIADLLDYVETADCIAFTGSATTGASVRAHPRILATGARVNIEADSLNASLLAPDVLPESALFAAFVREAVRELTAKAGQKCTAIRRILVSERQVDSVVAALTAELQSVIVGDPRDDVVTMGPVVSPAQYESIAAGLASLNGDTEVVFRASNVPDGPCFVAPTLLLARGPAQRVHEVEIFGPVATVVPYRDTDEAFALAVRGGGSLAVSVFSTDAAFLAESARRLASSHGRVLLVDSSIIEVQTGHGIVLPSLNHGGPGRAGGGEELGGARGLRFYHQWTALQGPTNVLETIASTAGNVRA